MKYKLLLILFIGIFASSCTSKKNLTYFSDLPDLTGFKTAIVNAYEPKIQEGDILSINMNSLDAASNALFNYGTLENLGGRETNANLGKEGFLVGKDGSVNYPVIGKIELAGHTISEAHEILRKELLTYVKDPIVNIRYLNFKVTVIGEVQRPTTFTVDNDRINVLEALGMAGDMTPYGLRNNVLIIREANGERQMARLNLNESSSLESPFFYLRQNDIVYVEPNATKDPSGERTLRIVSTVASVVTALSLLIFRTF